MENGYHFLPRTEVKNKETVVLFGDEADPAIQASKKRIEESGRSVQIDPRADHDTGFGPCGLHYCSCTTPCKSFIHQSYNPQ